MPNEPPRRVLVVEDEAIVAMLIEDLLLELGHTVVGVAATPAEAIDMVRTRQFDLALLDINLGDGHTSFEAAVLLGELHRPFAWLTGYGAPGVPDQFETVPVLGKPIDPDLLAKMVRNLR